MFSTQVYNSPKNLRVLIKEKTACQHMIQNQLKPFGINTPTILNCFLNTPRTPFITTRYKHYVYSDIPIPLLDEQYVLTPKIIGKIIQELTKNLNIKNLLDVGTGSAYSCVLWSQLVQKVTSLEINNTLHQKALKKLESTPFQNIQLLQADLLEYLKDDQTLNKFDCMVIESSLPKLPTALKGFVQQKKSLFAFIGTPTLAKATLFEYKNNAIAQTQLFDAMGVPTLLKLPQTNHFIF